MSTEMVVEYNITASFNCCKTIRNANCTTGVLMVGLDKIKHWDETVDVLQGGNCAYKFRNNELVLDNE